MNSHTFSDALVRKTSIHKSAAAPNYSDSAAQLATLKATSNSFSFCWMILL